MTVYILYFIQHLQQCCNVPLYNSDTPGYLRVLWIMYSVHIYNFIITG